MSSSSNDIAIECKARRCRYAGAECFVEYEGHMMCTLSHWLPSESSWPAVPDFDFTYNTTVGWELLLHPLDVMIPSPRNHRRCRANSMVSTGPASSQSYRISGYDITEAKALGNQRLMFRTATCEWEIQCHTRNSHDLLFACLSQVKRVDDQRPPDVTDSATDESSVEDDYESFTDRYIMASASRESFGEKLERKWGKAVHGFQEMVNGSTI